MTAPPTEGSPLPDAGLSIGQCATLACLLEVTAPKPGNVHRGADFPNLHLADFMASATMLGEVMSQADDAGVGETARAAIRATRRVVATNTNLGIILLLAPLAAVPRPQPLSRGVINVLRGLTATDAAGVYAAIREAQPGGMGQVSEHDVHESPPQDLLEAMQAAEHRDRIAWQYTHDFADIWWARRQLLGTAIEHGSRVIDAILWTHVGLLARYGDSLIARKRGEATSQQAAQIARAVVAAAPSALREAWSQEPASESDEGSPEKFQATSPRRRPAGEPLIFGSDYQALLADLDFWLRSDLGRNPGTTADLVTATLFAALRDGQLTLPCHW